MRPASPDPLEDTPDTGTATTVKTNSNTIDTSILSSIGPMHNKMAYACHLARQNKLNVTQCVLLDELAQVCLNVYHPFQCLKHVLGTTHCWCQVLFSLEKPISRHVL